MTDGGCDQEINTRATKANQVFAMLKTIWRSTGLSIHTNVRIFKRNILSIFLYDSVL